MKTLLIALVGIVFTAGCQQDPQHSLRMRLLFPASLAHKTPRYRRFLARARHLHVEMQTKAGAKWSGTFVPASWEALLVPAMNFPQGAGDSLSICIGFWDLTTDGFPRADPVLTGSKTLAAQDFLQAATAPLAIRLSLQVRADEYD